MRPAIAHVPKYFPKYTGSSRHTAVAIVCTTVKTNWLRISGEEGAYKEATVAETALERGGACERTCTGAVFVPASTMADPSTGLEKLIDQHEKAVDMAQASITSAVQTLLQVVEQQKIELLQAQQRIDRLEQELEEARQDNRDITQGEGADHAALLLEMNRLRARCNEETMSEQQFRELIKTCAGDGGPPRKEIIPEISVGMKHEKVAQLRASLRLSSATPLSIGSYEPNMELPGILKEQVARAKSMKIAPTEEQLLLGSGPPSCSIDVCSEPVERKEEENEDECPKADPRVDSTTPEEDVAPAPLLQPPTLDGPQAGGLQPNKNRVRPLSSHRLVAAVPERSALSAEVVGQLQELKEREKALDEETRVQRAAAAALIASHSHRIALRLRFNRAVASIHDTPEASAGRLRNEVIREFVNSEASYSYFLEMVVTVRSHSCCTSRHRPSLTHGL